MALQPRTRRDTPAQDTQYKLGRARQQRTDNKDYSALQSAGMYFDDRDAESEAIGNVISNTTRPTPPPTGNTGSPTLRRAGQSALAGARAGAQSAQQWRDDTVRGDTAGGAGFPSSAATVGRTMDRMRSNATPAARGAGPQTTEASRTPGTQTGTLRSALNAVGEFFSGSDGPPRQPIGRDGWTPSTGIDFHRQIGGRSAPPDGRGGNTPGAPGVPGGPAQAPAQLDPTALGMARGVGSGQGYATGPDGRTTFYADTQRNSGPGNLSVTGNMAQANDEFLRANAIRQQTIDAQRPQNQVTVIGDAGAGNGGAIQGAGGIDAQIQRLVRDAGSTRDPWQRAAINRQIQQLQSVADRGVEQQSDSQGNQIQLALQQMRNQGALATTLAGQQPDSVNPYDAARAQQVVREMQQGEQTAFPTYDPDELEAIMSMPTPELQQAALQQYTQRIDQQFAGAQLDDMLSRRGASRQDALESYQAGELDPNSELGMLMQRVYGGGQTEDFAGGGLVPEFSAIGFAQGGMVPDQYGAQMGPGMDMGSAVGMGAPGHQGIDLMQVEYDQYAQGAQQLGVPAIPFEEFVGLKQQAIPQPPGAPGATQPMTGALQSAVRMAKGGMVPGQDPSDTSGKMIVDPDPDAPQDSIPAVIDGTRPAKLDSGEFVIPRDVVMFYGTDKLNKMIEQAKEKGQGNGTQPGSASAVQQSAPQAGR